MDTYLEQYRLSRGIERGTVDQFRYVLNAFSRWLGHRAAPQDLTDDAVNRWLDHLVSEGTTSRETIRSKRRNLLTIWRAAFEDGAVPTCPRRIRPIKRARLAVPEAWNLESLGRLLAWASDVPGRFKRQRFVKRADFWKAFILVGYFSGLRFADLLELTWEQLGTDGRGVVIQGKTGNAVHLSIPPEAMVALQRIALPERRRIFGDVLSRGRIQRGFRELVRSAGLRGSIKWLRRSGATWVESVVPGSATAFLGHRSPGLAARHYIDARLLTHNRPMPPPLTGTG